ncbi:MAG: hypothetical protein V1929_11470 [bacterium]
MNPKRALQVLVLVVALAAAGGCVTETSVDDGHATTLFVTRAGETASIGWMSKPGLVYTLLYSDGMAANSSWQVVPGAANIVGDGGQITLTDQIANSAQRYYRLQIGKAK